MRSLEEVINDVFKDTSWKTIESLWKYHEECNANGFFSTAAAVEDIYRNFDIRYTVNGPKFSPFRDYDAMQDRLYTDISMIFITAYGRDIEAKRGREQTQEQCIEEDPDIGNKINIRIDGVDIGKAKVVSVFTGHTEITENRNVRPGGSDLSVDMPLTKQVCNIMKHDFSQREVTIEKLPESTKVSFAGLKPLDFEVAYDPDNDAKSALALLTAMDHVSSDIDNYQSVLGSMYEALLDCRPGAEEYIQARTGLPPEIQEQTLETMLHLLQEREEELIRFTNNTASLRQMLMKQLINPGKQKKKDKDIDR